VLGVVELGDTPSIVRVTTDFREPLPDRSYRIQVRAIVTSIRPDGMPDGPESERLAKLEDDLVDGAASRALLVAIVTAPGIRDLWFYAGTTEWVNDWAGAVKRAHADRVTEFRVAEDPAWAMYQALRDRGEAANADREVLDRLAAAGARLDLPREIRYCMFFPDERRANDAAEILRQHEYTVNVQHRDDSVDYALFASHHERAVPAVIAHMTNMLGKFARDHGGKFDGWEAAVTP
jgi:hypothetical protein